MINVLELFSGTGSVGKVCKELGWDSLSLDLELDADIKMNIIKWVSAYLKEYPIFITISNKVNHNCLNGYNNPAYGGHIGFHLIN